MFNTTDIYMSFAAGIICFNVYISSLTYIYGGVSGAGCCGTGGDGVGCDVGCDVGGDGDARGGES